LPDLDNTRFDKLNLDALEKTSRKNKSLDDLDNIKYNSILNDIDDTKYDGVDFSFSDDTGYDDMDISSKYDDIDFI
jgi:hypothetical protein